MNCPYDKMTLQIALIGAANKMEMYLKENGEGSEDKIAEKLNSLSSASDRAQYNRLTAEHHGISVEALINSPNYVVLQSEYTAHLFNQAVSFLQEGLKLEHKEAWAVLMSDQL